MNPYTHITTQRPLPALALATLLACTAMPATAGPGAHGPNGEHLDGPATMVAAAAFPRMEAKSETFELVATLLAGGLSVLIDRYETNEPVLGAALEVESGGIKARATFQADQGTYAVDDPKLLAQLRAAGEHALVFTLVAGQDSDLLDGTLVGTATRPAAMANNDHGHDHALDRTTWIGAAVAALGLIGSIAWWRQRRHQAGQRHGGL